ncbi:MAG: hypothetical protein O7A04_12065 [Acidobacteria bacterium]|nr:hypothetical protein [Acidobacteriota bacterium]
MSSDAARQRLRTRAAEIGALWFDVNAEVEATTGISGQIELETPQAVYRLDSSLIGAHQRRNLALAVRAAEVLALDGWSRISAAAIVEGVRRCRWPGRLEAVALPGGRQVLLDAAHNAQGAVALGEYLAQTGGENCLLFGALGDKDAGAVLPPLAALASQVILTAPDSPRATRPDTLTALVIGCPVAVYDDVGAALEAALAAPEGRLVVCGSIYLVGDVRRRLRRRFGRPPAAVDVDLVAAATPGCEMQANCHGLAGCNAAHEGSSAKRLGVERELGAERPNVDPDGG